jgi:transposase
MVFLKASRPSREELIIMNRERPEESADLILSLFAKIDEMALIIETQAAKILSLEERIKSLESNSRTSSKPPSSDQGNFGNPPKPKSMRGKSNKSQGGQKGHKGNTLEKVSTPDHIIEHQLPPEVLCPKCAILTAVKVKGYGARQVFDLPPVSLEVTEHRAQQCECEGCHTIITATYPKGVSAPTQYGPNIKAAAVYLNSYQLLPYKRLKEAFADLFNVHLSQGTLANIVKSVGTQAATATTMIREALINAKVLHSDETGCRLNGKRHWLHVASTSELTFYHFDAKRGFEAMERMAILPFFKQRLIHDFLSAYYRYTECLHGACNAHILRELAYAYEQLDQAWAQALIDLLLKAKKLTEESPEGLSKITTKELETQYQNIVQEGLGLNPEVEREAGKRGQLKRSKQLNLLRRLQKNQAEVLAFVYDPGVPFDNNQAERDLRMMKTREKISGGFGNAERARHFCDLRSVISSTKKQQGNVLHALAGLIANPLDVGDQLIGRPE